MSNSCMFEDYLGTCKGASEPIVIELSHKDCYQWGIQVKLEETIWIRRD